MGPCLDKGTWVESGALDSGLLWGRAYGDKTPEIELSCQQSALVVTRKDEGRWTDYFRAVYQDKEAKLSIQAPRGQLLYGQLGGEALAATASSYPLTMDSIVALVDRSIPVGTIPLEGCLCFAMGEIALLVKEQIEAAAPGSEAEVWCFRRSWRPDEYRLHKFRMTKSFTEAFAMEEKIMSLVADWCLGLDWDYLRMGLHEMLANAVEHAKTSSAIEVAVTKTAGMLCLSVDDGGQGFNWRAHRDKPLLNGPFDRGRGIPLTVLCLDRVIYNRLGNRVCLVKKL